jgi:TolB protein
MNKTMRLRIIITAILISLLATIPSTALSQYYLGVIKGEAKKIPLVVIDLFNDTGSPGLRSLALDVLQADLRRSQIFDVMDPKKLDLVYAGKDDPQADAIKRGGTFGLTGVAWARLSRKGSDIILSGRLYDAVTGMRLASKEYYGNEDTVRRMAHTFADEIVSQYTGEKGVAKTRIACVSDKTGHKELYVMDYDGQNLRKLTADRSISMSPAWSPDGRVLAYVSYRDRNPDLYGLDMESGRRWKISGAEGLNISPAWAPNGKRLALALSKEGGTEIYTMTMEGNDLERLTYGIADNVSPSWSPNGREIVFTSGRGGSPQLYIMGVDGTDARRITYEGSYNASPHWSPRGDRIVFVSQTKGLFKIATINPDGSDFRVLTSGPGNDENPMWSPSGRQLVFSSNPAGSRGKSGIYIMNADGTELERITPNDVNYTSPSWSP